MYLVCSVVLTSGPDEALMRRCARVMADWSSEPKFAKEMGTKVTAGTSFSVLMRSVSPETQVSFVRPPAELTIHLRKKRFIGTSLDVVVHSQSGLAGNQALQAIPGQTGWFRQYAVSASLRKCFILED